MISIVLKLILASMLISICAQVTFSDKQRSTRRKILILRNKEVYNISGKNDMMFNGM